MSRQKRKLVTVVVTVSTSLGAPDARRMIREMLDYEFEGVKGTVLRSVRPVPADGVIKRPKPRPPAIMDLPLLAAMGGR